MLFVLLFIPNHSLSSSITKSFYNKQMVRVLVATAIREAAAGADKDALLNLMEATCRRATAPPAPAEGLCLVDVGYEDFNEQRCFIAD
jgi:tRNA U38,U39,U40 pseudouridine synthase TruA